MNEIKITGLKISACHGVCESEKVTPQPFVFDIVLGLNAEAAAYSDDIARTADYAQASAIVNDYCRNNSFNLIERLSYGAAFLLAEKFTLLAYVEVTVHKPHAPIGLPFGDVSFTARVERNTVALSLGSSEGDKRANLGGAIAALGKVRGIKILKVSDYIATAPYGGVAKNEFLNCALTAECLLSPRALLDELHRIEESFARKRTVRWDDRTLDMDIVFFGNKIIEEEGLCVPHPDYKSRDFVLAPLKSIAPDLVCPLTHKRLSDL